MSFTDLLWFLAAAAIIWYLLDAMRVNELARHIGRQACAQADVLFLDDSVVMKKICLRRNANGQLTLYREYQFEFTSDGSQRYQGSLSLLGKQLMDVQLEVYRIPPESSLH